MTTRTRLALLAAAAAIAVAGLIVLKPDDKKTMPAPVTQITVKGARPVGGIKKITVSKGETVRFVVTSDVADEIHVHGYNFKKEVKAGGKVSFSFPAKIDGEFEVELEARAQQIASLVVNP